MVGPRFRFATRGAVHTIVHSPNGVSVVCDARRGWSMSVSEKQPAAQNETFPADPVESTQIVWIGKLRPNYPMLWRSILGVSAWVVTPILFFLVMIDAIIFVAIFLGGLGLFLGTVYLAGLWFQRRTGGGPECLFAVTGEGVEFHSGPELRRFGFSLAEGAALVEGKPLYLLMRENAKRADDLFMSWAEIRSVEIRPDLLLVFVSRGLRGPIPLFCTPDNFEAVRRIVLQRAPQARIRANRPISPSCPNRV